MNADLKRVRENSLDSGPSSSKRRALASGASSPSSAVHGNNDASGSGSGRSDEDDDGIEDWMRVVETKRKEAIYRQMLDYRRSYQREQSRANALERQRRQLEQSLRGVEACWAQLVTSVRDRAGRIEGLPEPGTLDPTIDPSQPQDEIDSALQNRLSATLRLVSVFAEAAAGRQSANLGGDLNQQLSRLQTEASTLRANSSQLQAQVDQLCQSRDTYRRDLEKAEKKLDKQKMAWDKEREQWRTHREPSGTPAKPVANGSGHSTPNVKAQVGEDVKPDIKPDISVDLAAASEAAQRAAEMEQLAQTRREQLDALRAEHTGLTMEVDRLKVLAHHPSEAVLRESPFFQVYLNQLSTQLARAEALQGRCDMAEQKLDQLREGNLEFRDAVLAEARTEVETLRQQMGKKDTDLARLRGQRDEMNAELLERRQREAEKTRFADEIEGLCNARQERITFLVSEVRRLKGKLAAQDAAEGYLAFLKGDGGVDGDYIKDLEDRLAKAQGEIAALKSQIESLSGNSSSAVAESAIRAELAEAKRALERYQRVLGPNPDVAADVTQLIERLQKETETRGKLELQLSEAEAATNALYAEVDGLSKLWEGLDHTLKTKVFELKDGELRMARLSTEKAKADNKYFQAMRTKEAIEAECKTAQRSVDKQLKLLERAQEVERTLTTQITQQEKGITQLKNTGHDLQTQLATVAAEKRQIELRLQQSQAALAEAQQLARTRVTEAAADKEARVKAQEEREALQKTLKKVRDKYEAVTAASAAGNVSAAETHIREEREKLLKILRCSCCELNFKQQVITKCFHTFCKECLDSRIASRQRKCPACGLAFAKEDCQTLFWQ